MEDRWTRAQFARSLAGAAGMAAGLVPQTVLAARRTTEADVSKLYDAAKKEGKVTWWTAHYTQDVAERVRDEFKKKYPGVDVELLRQTAQVIYQRLTNDIKSNVHEVDVFASTDEAHYVALKKQNVLAQFTPADIDKLHGEFRAYDPDQMYQTGALGFVLVNYNKAKLKGPAPRRWTEINDPKWKGQLTTGHPAFSGYVGNWVLAMNDKYGWDFFKKVAENQPKINRSVFDTVTDLLSGERTIGAGPDNLTLQKRAQGSPVDISFPQDDSIVIVSGVGVMKDAPHPNAARLFENFYYSREYSNVMAQTFNFPLRTDVPAAGGMQLGKIKYYRNKSDRLATGIPEVIAKWRETFGV